MDKFDKPLNTWIEEEVEVPTISPEVNEEEGRVEFKKTTKKVKQRTMYSDSTPTKVICSDHVYAPLNPGRYLFKCTKCDWHRIAPPVTFKFDQTTGKLTYRKSGIQV